jgi:hypothetical protein
LYWKKIVLQDEYMDTVEKGQECAIQKAQNKETIKRPTYLTNLGTKPV